MSYPKKILTVQPRQGLNYDVDASEAGPDFYSDVYNFLFRNSFAERVRFSRNIYVNPLVIASPVNLLHAVNTQINNQNYWLVVDENGSIWVLTANNAVQIDVGLLSAIANPYDLSSTLLNGIPVINHAFSPPVYWSGSGNLQVLPGWYPDSVCKKIVAFKYHLFALDISDSGYAYKNLVRWSAAAEPGTIPPTWQPDADNTAGSVELSEGGGGLLTAVPRQDSLIIYKKSSTYSCQFIGGNSIFSFVKVDAKHGALNRNSVADIGGRHFVVEQGDIVINDGTNRFSIGHDRVKNYLFSNLTNDNFENLFVVYNPEYNEVIIAYPEPGEILPSSALVYHIDSGAFGKKTLPLDASAPSGIAYAVSGFNTDTDSQLVFNDATEPFDDFEVPFETELTDYRESLIFVGQDFLEEHDSPDAIETTMFNPFIRKYDLTFGDSERIKFVKRLHIYFSPNYGGPRIRVGSRMNLSDSINWTSDISLTEPENIVNCEVMGRYISFEIRSGSLDPECKILKVNIEAELRGYF